MHVPEENLPRYRSLKNIADQFDRLGNSLSNIGAYKDANAMWSKRASWNARAQELRVAGEREAVEPPYPVDLFKVYPADHPLHEHEDCCK